MPDARVYPVAYVVSCLPPDHPCFPDYSVRVEWRETDRWAVLRGAFCLDAKGCETQEPIPSARTETFKRRYRHTLTDALDLARRTAPTLTSWGRTVTDVLGGGSATQRGDGV